ncbi:RNA-dependent DNA polymerase [Roseomonas frigidaquae]|uniref:RNA-dependent DNA polymerase n=1 Tax=Falsiroseomonas frigidaquae TaxID=487318 RepID=A0ABX1F949_9PROT|nr:reverse transcriptase domain-containing protein [Falsiroseomonas frigidaquae]NKE48760.1 RNA-dependent DNA polymerase [Falsiroseomonas frigidaquae]
MEKNYFLDIRRQKTLEKAWLAIQRNARSSKSEDTRNEVAAFASDLQNNLRRISRHLQKGTFKFPPAKGVKIPKDPKDKSIFRPLVVAKVESRVVQRAIHDVLITIPKIQVYVRTPHSFGGVKKDKEDNISAVPAAIQAVLDAIGNGGKFIIRSDITSFFTKIPKSSVTRIVSDAVQMDGFMDIFSKAIAVELENMAQLRESAKAFPIEDIGVAQGNSLSPLLGNIILYDFDKELNKDKDVRCIRYIDDFIIIAPNKSVAENAYSKALHILKGLGMDTSHKKTMKASVTAGFDFLGIELVNGFIRPSSKSQARMIASVEKTIQESKRVFRSTRKTGEVGKNESLLKTLNKISGIMQGWGKHYKFCNDRECLRRLDERILSLIREYLAAYRDEVSISTDSRKWNLLGIEAISQIELTSFAWPKSAPPILPASVINSSVEADQDSRTPPWE